MKIHILSDFKDDPELYVFPNLKYVGIELWQVISYFSFLSKLVFTFSISYFKADLWYTSCIYGQVKSGTLFNNVLITDDPEYAKQLAEETWGKQKDVSSFN